MSKTAIQFNGYERYSELMQEPHLLYETEKAWWFSKPAGWLSVYPTHPGSEPVLAAWVERQYHSRAYPVHRLDRETTGVILIAKTAEFHREASIWFEKRQVQKVYHFLAGPLADSPVWTCKAPIEGRTSETQFQVLERGQNFFLGEARPKTGRRHQIRIHLKTLGMPILGDKQYGGSAGARVFLHAFRLKTPDGVDVIAPYESDFEELRCRLKTL